ncbi:hypothetical protein PPROV_001012000 [Pycnococcus provasolii]|uniref:Bacterial Ig-like domain-containing protein n=1 Tax=Pycnococcus provasolii TaxID=41880 RepID=A0A830HW54_9CHLO|nr:hypothetical protein PPROV_001012000 [Pycnococcus provasolii]|mmetsp:Transcript_8757/g.23552  ORF Transcript_8757/g.23552 Transcript_8757/m.23552 type:complete len:398 (-) Transcript_8757:537-1730(-)
MLLLATCAYVANAVDIVFSSSSATGASKVYGGNYYATGSSLAFTWQTVADNSQAASGANLAAATAATLDGQTASAIQCYCRLRASQLTFSPAFTFTPDGTVEQGVGQDIGQLTATAAELADSGLYKLDSGSWKQGVHFPAFGIKGLSEGVHQLEAKAYTSAGVVDPTPACRKFIVDLTKPVTTITAPGASKQGVAPTFGGKVTDANIQATGGTTYRVEKVGDASFSSVTGSVATATDGSFTITLSTMADGLYQIYVRHQDMAGNLGSETMVEWTVDTAVPNTMVSSGPSSPTASTTASFLFACDESPCTYKYKVDSADNYSTSSTARLNLSSITPGVHTIEVHAIDVAGNEDLSAAAYTWTVFDATTYASLEMSAKFSLNGPTPLDYTPPAENYVHV